MDKQTIKYEIAFHWPPAPNAAGAAAPPKLNAGLAAAELAPNGLAAGWVALAPNTGVGLLLDGAEADPNGMEPVPEKKMEFRT